MMTKAVITKVDRRTYNTDFIERVHEASKRDQEWQERKTEVREMEQHHSQLPKHGEIIDELIYYKNRLYIPNNEELQT